MSERVLKVEPDVDKLFNSCNDCIYAADPEAICRIRQCVHAFSRLAECYRPRSKNKSMTYEGLVYTAWSQTLVDVPVFKEDIIATLPKNHGRLIDADDLEHITICSKTRNSGITRIEAPTIIEASEEGAVG